MAVLTYFRYFFSFGGIFYFFLTRLSQYSPFWSGNSCQSICSSLPSTKIICKRYHSWLNLQTIFIIIFCFKNPQCCYLKSLAEHSPGSHTLTPAKPFWALVLLLSRSNPALIRLVSSVSSKLSVLQTGNSVSQRVIPSLLPNCISLSTPPPCVPEVETAKS